MLRLILGKFCFVYLDDILIFGQNMTEHVEHLRTVLQLLRDHHLYAKLSKCTFARTDLEFLGHILSAAGLRVDPKKTSAVSVSADGLSLRTFLSSGPF